MVSPTINADRLWQTILDMAEIGATSDGGSCRLALSPEDAAARALLLTWCEPQGLRYEQDAIGNMFLRREGTDAAAGVIALGSHLDTVPTGGRFDGAFGVLAALEVIRVLREVGIETKASLELVNWTNEEGSRFRPAMMGSRVFAREMELDAALATVDDSGVSVARALRDSGQAGPLVPSSRGWSYLVGSAYRTRPSNGKGRRRYWCGRRHCACALFPAFDHGRAKSRRSDDNGSPPRQLGGCG